MKVVSFILFSSLFLSVATIAQDTQDQKYGISIDDDIGVRFKKNMGQHQIGAGARLSSFDNDSLTSIGDNDAYGLSGFYRFYRQESGDLRHFYEAELSYTESESTNVVTARTVDTSVGGVVGGVTTPTVITINTESETIGLGLYYGIEYFLAPQFSVEGKVGVRYSDTQTTYSPSNLESDGSSFRVPSSALSISYYW